MKRFKELSIVIAMVLSIALVFTSCGASPKEKALNEINNVKVSAFFEDEQDALKKLLTDYESKIEKAKSDEEVEKLLKAFQKDIKPFVTKDDKIKKYTKELDEQIAKMKGKDKDKAQKIFDEYKDKLDKAKTNADFKKMTDEIASKIKDATKVKIEVAANVTEPATSSNSSASSGSSKHSSSAGSSSKPSGSSKPSHQHSWTPHYATGYKTETYEYNVYRCSHGIEFVDYDSAYQHYIEAGDRGDGCNFGAVTKTGTQQVPYQYVDYYYCSCGATK